MTVRSSVPLVLAAGCFLLYPLLRGFGPETGAAGAAHYASVSWLAAHLLAMGGFVALAMAARGGPDRSWRRTELLTWVAVVFLLPYYGAEAFALHALGRWVAAGGDERALAVADGFRYAPAAVVVFAVGLLTLAVVGVMQVVQLRHASLLARVGSVITAVGLVTFLPQFFGPGGLRIAHGAVLCVGLLLLAVARARSTDRTAA